MQQGSLTVPVSAPTGPPREVRLDLMVPLGDEWSGSIPGAERHTGWDLPPPAPVPMINAAFALLSLPHSSQGGIAAGRALRDSPGAGGTPAPRGILRLRMCHGPAASLRKSPPGGSGGGGDSPDPPFLGLLPSPRSRSRRSPGRRPRSEGGEHSLAAAAETSRAVGDTQPTPHRPAAETATTGPGSRRAPTSAALVKPLPFHMAKCEVLHS